LITNGIRTETVFEQGLEAWSKLQDERRAKGFTYTDGK